MLLTVGYWNLYRFRPTSWSVEATLAHVIVTNMIINYVVWKDYSIPLVSVTTVLLGGLEMVSILLMLYSIERWYGAMHERAERKIETTRQKLYGPHGISVRIVMDYALSSAAIISAISAVVGVIVLTLGISLVQSL